MVVVMDAMLVVVKVVDSVAWLVRGMVDVTVVLMADLMDVTLVVEMAAHLAEMKVHVTVVLMVVELVV